jgi:hypothetical protein
VRKQQLVCGGEIPGGDPDGVGTTFQARLGTGGELTGASTVTQVEGCSEDQDGSPTHGSSTGSREDQGTMRQRAKHSWYYEPAISAPVAGPALTKRVSQPPQRLMSSKLGKVSDDSGGRHRLGLVIRVPESLESAQTSNSGVMQGSGSSTTHDLPDAGLALSSRPAREARESSDDSSPPPVSSRVEAIGETPTVGFSIRLLFPDGEGPTLIYPVESTMLVSQLRLQVSELMEAVYLVLGPMIS